MGTQQQIQQAQNPQGSKRTSKVRVIIAIIVVLSIVVGITIAILNVLDKIHIPLPTTLLLVLTVVVIPVLSLVLGPLMTFLQWVLPISPDKPEPPTTAVMPSAYPTINNIINIPSSSPPSPPPATSPYRGIIGFPSPTNPNTIQQREKAVKQAYEKLIQPEITAIVLTGIGGIGKSTLAALIYRYAE